MPMFPLTNSSFSYSYWHDVFSSISMIFFSFSFLLRGSENACSYYLRYSKIADLLFRCFVLSRDWFRYSLLFDQQFTIISLLYIPILSDMYCPENISSSSYLSFTRVTSNFWSCELTLEAFLAFIIYLFNASITSLLKLQKNKVNSALYWLEIVNISKSRPAVYDSLDNSFQLGNHEVIIDDDRDLLTLFVELQGFTFESQMFFFGCHVVKDYHLHVHAVISFLQQSFLLTLIEGPLYLNSELFLYLFDMVFCLQHNLNRFVVLAHFTENGGFVEVGGYHVIFLLPALVLEDLLFQLNCVVNGSEGHSVLFFFLKNAGEVVETENLEFFQSLLISNVLIGFRQHQNPYGFVQHFFVIFRLLFGLQFVVFHRYFVYLLDKTHNQFVYIRNYSLNRLCLVPVGLDVCNGCVDYLLFQKQQALLRVLLTIIEVFRSEGVHKGYRGVVEGFDLEIFH